MEGFLQGLAAVIAAVAAMRAASHAKQGRKDTATNHGKRPGEYLEMVAEIRDGQDAMTTEMSALARLIAEHTIQDAQNFAELRMLIAGKADK